MPSGSYNVEHFGSDGVTYLGRMASLANVFILTMLICGLFVGWTDVDKLSDGFGTQGADVAGKVSFGIDQYCVELKVANWNDEKVPVCFKYDQDITTCQAGGKDCVQKSACDRFDGLCRTQYLTSTIGWSAVASALIAGAFSESSKIVFVFQLFTFVLSTAAYTLWIEWQNDVLVGEVGSIADAFGAEPSLGYGARVFIAGSVLSLISAILAFFGSCHKLDDGETTCVAPGHENGGDGITVTGRLGSFCIEIIWIATLFAILTPDWTVSSGLGNDGGFCLSANATTTADQQLCDTREATFGLWKYCVEERFDYLSEDGADKHKVCVTWDKSIQITGTDEALDGDERFGSSWKKTTGVACMVAACLAAMVGDVISEKLLYVSILSCLGAIANLCGFAFWLSFESAMEAAGSTTLGMGAGLAVFAWVLGFLTCFCYCHNHDRNRKVIHEAEYCMPASCHSCGGGGVEG